MRPLMSPKHPARMLSCFYMSRCLDDMLQCLGDSATRVTDPHTLPAPGILAPVRLAQS